MSIFLNTWNKIWYRHNKADLQILNAAFDGDDIFSFSNGSIQHEYDGIFTQVKRIDGRSTPNLLFGDDAGIKGAKFDICDDMNSLGEAVAGVVATTSYDMVMLYRNYFISADKFGKLGIGYGQFFRHETHYGNYNGASSEPSLNRDNHVYLRVSALLNAGQDAGNLTANAYLQIWDRDVSARNVSAQTYDNSTTYFLNRSGEKIDFGYVARPGHDGSHLLIDTINFASGLVELAAVQDKLSAMLHDPDEAGTGLTHDDLVKLAGLHGWEDLRALNEKVFDQYFGRAEKVVDGKMTLDANLAEVLTYGAIETAQKILAIDMQVMAYNSALDDRLDSIFSMLTMTSGGFSNEQRLSASAFKEIAGDLRKFESGAITTASILHGLQTGWWQGHAPGQHDYGVGYGLNDLAQIKVAHFM